MAWLRGFGLAAGALALSACAHVPVLAESAGAGLLCDTGEVAISTGFSGAGQHGCALAADGPVLTVWPEASIAGPINPSPWYAFTVESRSASPVHLRLDYAGYWHRYTPWISRDEGATWARLDENAVSVSEDGHIATLALPAGEGRLMVAGQPIVTPAGMSAWSDRLAERYGLQKQVYGRSLDGRSLEALVAGPEDAARVVIAMTGQHPPEYTGVAAFKAFAETLMEGLPERVRADTRIVLLPLINPDGRARGHWRHNHGGLDLNRDWLEQSQPETRAAAAFLAGEADGKEAVAFLDFHSTQKTLVYTPPFAENYADMGLPQSLKDAFDEAMDPDPEWISGHNSGSGTSKNWALQTLDVAGLTIELGDNASETETARLGGLTAETLIVALE